MPRPTQPSATKAKPSKAVAKKAVAKKAVAKKAPSRRSAAQPARAAQPTLDRAIELTILGDVGIASGHRIGGWICSQVLSRTRVGTRVGVWSGDSPMNVAAAVSGGFADIAVMTPAGPAAMALDGRGPFAGDSYPNLRSLGTLPQLDRLLFAVRADLGIRSFADLRKKKPALRIATTEDDPGDWVGWAARRVMEAAGIPVDVLESWGGRYVDFSQFPPRSFERNYPGRFPQLVHTGGADACIQEAIMLAEWKQAVADPGLVILPVEDKVLAKMEKDYGWGRADLPAGHFEGQDEAITTLDFADFAIVCSEAMPEDLAHLIAWCMGETRMVLQGQYMHTPPRDSQVTWPLDPVAMGKSTIPLHPGAKRYYDTLTA